MKSTMRIFCCLGIVLLGVLFCVSPAAFANNPPTITAQLNDPPSNNVLDGIYVGPYNATNMSGGGSFQMVCDDFKDESNYNAATYTVNTLSSLGNSIWGASNMMLYEDAAWLALQMFHTTGLTQAYYQYAVWAVFQPSQVGSWLLSAGDTQAYAAIFGSGGLLQQAQQMCQNGTSCNYSNLLILTPNCSGATCQEQEFFVFAAPEGGTALLYLLLVGLVCGGAGWHSRRRSAAAGTA